MKDAFWNIFRDYLWSIEGMKTEYEHEIHEFVTTKGSYLNEEGFNSLVTFLTTTFHLQITTEIRTTLHYDYMMSVSESMGHLMGMKEEDIHHIDNIVAPAPAEPILGGDPSTHAPAEPIVGGDAGTHTPPAIGNVEEEFTHAERQILFFWMEYEMQMITQQQYYESITRLGFSFESVTELIEVKQHQLHVMEEQFFSSMQATVTESISKIEGLNADMMAYLMTLFSS